jgi:hypothetical protein
MSVRNRNYPRNVELGPSRVWVPRDPRVRRSSVILFLVIGLVVFLLIVANLDYRTSRTPPRRAVRQQRTRRERPVSREIHRSSLGWNDVVSLGEREELMQLLHDNDLNYGRRRVIRRNCD